VSTEDREELSEPELVIAAQAYALEGRSFAPTDDYTEVCERLVERGWLSSWQAEIAEEPEPVGVYTMTTQGRTAIAMAGLLEVGPGQQN